MKVIGAIVIFGVVGFFLFSQIRGIIRDRKEKKAKKAEEVQKAEVQDSTDEREETADVN